MEGAVPSYSQLNSSAAELTLPDASASAPAATLIVVSPSPPGVKVKVYDVPDPVKSEIVPPDTVTSTSSKSVVDSEVVIVTAIVASLEESPSSTSDASMVTVGPVASYSQLNSSATVLVFPIESVNPFAAMLTVVSPSALGANVAV